MAAVKDKQCMRCYRLYAKSKYNGFCTKTCHDRQAKAFNWNGSRRPKKK